MAKQLNQLNVNLGFTANTNEAKAQLRDLSNQLDNLIKHSSAQNNLGVTKELHEASRAAALLKTQLEQATNVKTGKLDLGLFSESLSKSGYTLEKYRDSLTTLGPEGRKVFSTLAQSVMDAEVPLRRSNVLLQEFGTTLKNTVRWQLSSSLLHGLMGTIQGAYSYAQDLNKSLNSIRIVTGKSKDDMADFAKEANASARALSTTTTAYTDSSLIFFQQGLDEEAVKKRTETVLKMSNVTGESAKDVASYMTAIWNNFDDGSKSLEHYSDVMTALGAATASSTKEIAGGMQKFVAVANTVGLSYEYAASALATVVAQTRQSEETVGTAFKTIFARIQDLKLGKTLDDGTSLGKYSQALASVGVYIKDDNDNLKKMDDILDELGSKWGTLSRDTKVATAQAVAGTRQYSQLLALMDNWDMFKNNLSIAEGSDGALDKQAEIYAEGWEAARKKVKAAAQDIYDSILNDDFFISMANVFAKVIDGVHGVMDSLGGMKGVLLGVGSVFLNVYGKEATKTLSNLSYTLANTFNKNKKNEIIDRKKESNTALMQMGIEAHTEEGEMLSTAYNSQAEAQNTLLENADKLNESQKENVKILLDQHKVLVKNVEEATAYADKARKADEFSTRALKRKLAEEQGEEFDEFNFDKAHKNLRGVGKFNGLLETGFAGMINDEEAKDKVLSLAKTFDKNAESMEQVRDKVEKTYGPEVSEAILTFSREVEDQTLSVEELSIAYDKLFDKLQKIELESRDVLTDIGVTEKQQDKMVDSGVSSGYARGYTSDAEQKSRRTQEDIEEGKIPGVPEDATNRYIDLASNVMALGMAFSTTQTAIDSFSQAIETGEGFGKAFIETLSGIAFTAMPAAKAIKGLSETKLIESKVTKLLDFANKQEIATEEASIIVKMKSAVASKILAIANKGVLASSLALAGVVVTLTALAFVIKGVSKAFEESAKNSPEGKLKTLKETAEESSKAFEKVTTSVENLKSSLSDIDSGYAKIKTMKEGSAEWAAEVDKLNGKIMELVKKYPKLKVFVDPDNNKLLRIDDNSFQQVIAEQRERVAQAQKVKEYTDLRVKEKSDELERPKMPIQGIKEEDIRKAYDKYGETMFSKGKADKIADTLLDNVIKRLQKGSYYEQNASKTLSNSKNFYKDTLKDFLRDRDKVLAATRETASNEKDAQLTLWGSQAGSLRNASQIKDLMGMNYFNDQRDKLQKKLDKDFEWKNNSNYAEGSAEKNTLDKIASILGENVSYKGQKDGQAQFVSTEGGKDTKISLTKEDVIDKIVGINLNGSDLAEGLAKKIQIDLKNTYKNIPWDKMASNSEDWINLDNFRLSLNKTLPSLGFDKKDINAQGEKILQSDAFKDADGGYSQDKLSNFNSNLSSINKENIDNLNAMQKASEELGSKGAEGVSNFVSTINQLGTMDKLKGMTEDFKAAAKQLGLKESDAKGLQEYAEHLAEVSKNSKEFSKDVSENAETAKSLAIQITRMNKGIDALADGIENWADVLENSSDKASKEFSDALSGIKNSLADILGVEADYFSDDFIENHIDQIKLAAQGNEEAIESLRNAAADDIILNIKANLDEDAKAEVDSLIADLREEAASIKIGAELDDGAFVEKAQELIDKCHLTTQEANRIFDMIGFEPDLYEESVPIPQSVPEMVTKSFIAPGLTGHNKTVQGADNEYNYPEIHSVTYEAGKTTAVGDFHIPALAGKGKKPKINKLTRKASANISNYSSSHGGGRKPGTKKSKSSGGGGGRKKGGGGDKEKKKKTEKPKESELDPYREQTRAIAKVKDKIDKLGKAKSHTFGTELINNIKKENKLLEQQYKNYEALGGVINSELARIKKELTTKYNYGVSFDSATGEIKNYAAAYNRALADYNNAVNRYNASAQSEADEKAFKQSGETYDKFVKLLGEYDKTLDKRMDNEQTKLDNQYQVIENNYKAWETNIEVHLELGDARKEWKKFWQEVDKDFRSIYKDFGRELADITDNFNQLSKSNFATNLNAVQNIKRELEKIKAGGKSDRYASESEAANDLIKYSNQLRNDAKDLYDLYTSSWKSYLDNIDQVVDKWEKVLKEFDEINTSLEHNAKVVGLLYGEGDFAKELNGKVMDAQRQNNLALLNSLRITQASLKAEREQLIAQGAKETDEDVQKLTDAIKENQKELEANIENYLEGLTNQFKNSVEVIMSKMEKAMSGGKSFQKISDRWEDAKKASEGYYDEVERIYQLETMQNKWEDTINKAGSIKNQQKLKDLMEAQMNALAGKTKLSEYDIQLAEKQFAIAQAQAALEDAQNNKTSMKLTRGTDGNWSYQYVADDEDIRSKQQALMDANNEWYEFTKTSWSDMTDEIMSDIQAAQERLTDLMTEYNTADEDRRAEIKEEYDYLYNYYYGEDGLIATKVQESADMQDELNKATMGSLWELYNEDEENYKDMTDTEQALMDALRENGINSYEMLKDFVAGEGGIYDQMRDKIIDVNRDSLFSWNALANDVIGRWHKDPDSVSKEIDAAYKEVIEAQKQYDKAVQEGVAASGIEFRKIGGPGGVLDEILQKTAEVINKNNELGKEIAGIDNMKQHVEKLKIAWESVRDSIQGAIYDLEYYLSVLTGGQYQSSYDGRDTSGTRDDGSSGSGGGQSNGDGKLAVGDTATFTGSYYYTSAGATPTGTLYSGVTNGVVVDAINDNEYGVHIHSADGAYGDLGWIKRSQLSGFDTGGFTGDWDGNNGRLALLHSKELVLNKEDTKNILSAVDSVRDISSINSSVVDSIANGISSMVRSMLNFSTPNFKNVVTNHNTNGDTNNTFEVTMNVDGGDVEEIKEAILNLPTFATQYLMKNNK